MSSEKKSVLTDEEKQHWQNEGEKEGSGDRGGIFGRSPWGYPTDAEGEWEEKQEYFEKGKKNAK